MIFDVYWLLGEELDIDDIDDIDTSIPDFRWGGTLGIPRLRVGALWWLSTWLRMQGGEGQKLYGAFLTFWLRVLRQCDGAKTAW